jgi:hypothetical protein
MARQVHREWWTRILGQSKWTEGGTMHENTWKKLCQEIMTEQDPERLFALADALNKVLEHPYVKLDEPVDSSLEVPIC